MNKIYKPAGHNQTIQLIINDTSTTSTSKDISVVHQLGRLTVGLFDILNNDVFLASGKNFCSLTEEWNIIISDNVKDKILELTSTHLIHTAYTPHEKTKIDALDVLFGKAEYNKIEGGEQDYGI